MPNLDAIQEENVRHTYKLYPIAAQQKLLYIRQMIFDIAKQNTDVSEIEETLKWGEPAYVAKSGSTIRLAWKASTPNYFAIYFICSTKLVETFKEIYPDIFIYEGNRAMIFSLEDEKIPSAHSNIACCFH